MEQNFYLSSHGSTHLYNLFVDQERTPHVYPIQGIPKGVEVEIHYKLKGGQMQSVLARSDSLSQSTKRNQTNFDENIYHDYMIIHVKGEKEGGIIHKIELIKDGVSNVFYDTIEGIVENIPNIEYSYEDVSFRAGLLELEPFSDEPEPEPEESEPEPEPKKTKKKRKSIENDDDWRQKGGGGLKPILIYEGRSRMKYDYNFDDEDEDFNVHLKKDDEIEIIKYEGEPEPSELFEDPDKWLYVKQNDGEDKEKNGQKKWVSKSFVSPKFYSGSAFNEETYGFLHATRPESWTDMKVSSPSELHEDGLYEQGCFKDQSFLNMLFAGFRGTRATGQGHRNWDPSLYLDYSGCKLARDQKNIINIYGSHCLNPIPYIEHENFGNVIPFITDKPSKWATLFKEELLEGAKEEVEYLEDKLKEKPLRLRSGEKERRLIITKKINKAKDAVKAMEIFINDELGPIRDDSRRAEKRKKKKKKKTKRKKKKKTKRKKKKKTIKK